MTMPTDIGAIDLMIGFPKVDASKTYDYLRETTHAEDASTAEFPAGYMFKEVPNQLEEGEDGVAVTIAEMDKWGVDIGMVGVGTEATARALKEHPGRFIGSVEIDPNDITGAVRKIRELKDQYDIKAVTTFPAGCNPQVPVNDRRYYPIYQTCIDLDIPIVSNAGIAGPRFPSACQDVMLFDEVCYDFPELRIVMRHGAEPWEELAVKLMLKWPNLYYMPSAFAPKHYPKAIIDYANTRGADKIMYAGYYPMGLSLERIFTEMPNVPFRDHVWPKFLRENAMRVFKLEEPRHEGNADRVRRQRARRGGDRGGGGGAARRPRPRCASGRTSRRSNRASPSTSASDAASCATPDRRRCTSRSSCSAASPATRSSRRR